MFGKEYCREDGDDLEDELLGEEAPGNYFCKYYIYYYLILTQI